MFISRSNYININFENHSPLLRETHKHICLTIKSKNKSIKRVAIFRVSLVTADRAKMNINLKDSFHSIEKKKERNRGGEEVKEKRRIKRRESALAILAFASRYSNAIVNSKHARV